jgi:hypothetical protein
LTAHDDPNRKEDSAHRHPSRSHDDTAGQYGGGEENAEGMGTDDKERFSEGQETTGETAEKEEVGTFAEGQAVTPDDPDELKEGEFSTGMEQGPHEPDRDVRRDRDT